MNKSKVGHRCDTLTPRDADASKKGLSKLYILHMYLVLHFGLSFIESSNLIKVNRPISW